MTTILTPTTVPAPHAAGAAAAAAAPATAWRRPAAVAAVGAVGLAVTVAALVGVSFGNGPANPLGSVGVVSASPAVPASGHLVTYARGPAGGAEKVQPPQDGLDLTIGPVGPSMAKPTGNCVGVNACNQFIADCVGAGGEFVEEHHNPKGQPNLGHCK